MSRGRPKAAFQRPKCISRIRRFLSVETQIWTKIPLLLTFRKKTKTQKILIFVNFSNYFIFGKKKTKYCEEGKIAKMWEEGGREKSPPVLLTTTIWTIFTILTLLTLTS